MAIKRCNPNSEHEQSCKWKRERFANRGLRKTAYIEATRSLHLREMIAKAENVTS